MSFFLTADPAVHAAVRACASTYDGQEDQGDSKSLLALRRLVVDDPRALTLRDAQGRTALCVALELGLNSAVRALIEAGAARSVFGAGAGASALICALPHAIGGRASAAPLGHAAAAVIDVSLAEHVSHLGLAERNRSCCKEADSASGTVLNSVAPTAVVPRPTVHDFSTGSARMCSTCGLCTRSGSSCDYAGGDESPGDPCGCGGADAGCQACGMCRSCCASSPKCTGTADGAGTLRPLAVGDLVTLLPGSAGIASLAGYSIVPGSPGVVTLVSGAQLNIKWLVGAQVRPRSGICVQCGAGLSDRRWHMHPLLHWPSSHPCFCCPIERARGYAVMGGPPVRDAASHACAQRTAASRSLRHPQTPGRPHHRLPAHPS
jgi:hypothetical protein